MSPPSIFWWYYPPPPPPACIYSNSPYSSGGITLPHVVLNISVPYSACIYSKCPPSFGDTTLPWGIKHLCLYSAFIFSSVTCLVVFLSPSNTFHSNPGPALARCPLISNSRVMGLPGITPVTVFRSLFKYSIVDISLIHTLLPVVYIVCKVTNINTSNKCFLKGMEHVPNMFMSFDRYFFLEVINILI